MRRVWPDTFVEETNLAQNISQLRRVLGETAAGRPYIETVPKLGYRFVADVVERNGATDVAHERPVALEPPRGPEKQLPLRLSAAATPSASGSV